MNKILSSTIFLFTTLTYSTVHSEFSTRNICGSPNPILSVADVNANGSVDADDITLIRNSKINAIYYALYDLDSNGKIDDVDIKLATQQLGLKSTKLDQQLTLLFNRNKHFQLVQDITEISSLGYVRTATSLAGHGEHWNDIIAPIKSDYLRPDGLNIPKIQDRVNGLFWSINAVPVFENGATDYPTPGGQWETQRVIAFSDSPPKLFDNPTEKWHTHAALCLTFVNTGATVEPVLNQFMTYAQCQSLPSLVKTPGSNKNYWVNIWMLHAWLFDLNPNGVFANTHSCIDLDSVSESTINGGRPVPPFFAE